MTRFCLRVSIQFSGDRRPLTLGTGAASWAIGYPYEESSRKTIDLITAGPARAKKVPFQYSKRNSKAGREWYDWLPVFERTTDDVFATIAKAGQSAHPVYAEGMSRLSCSFCVFASQADVSAPPARPLR